jgi:hypothetical protein
MTQTLTATVTAILISLFLVQGCSSTLGTHICVEVTCEENQSPIVGLPVELYLPGSETPLFTGTTNSEGWVSFGSGMPDGTYWIVYNYAGTRNRQIVEIDCSKITWKFGYTVDNPTVTKRFVYDLEWWTPAYPPKVGLEVTVTDQTGYSWTAVTDANGEISWSADIGYTYTLTWTYGGKEYSETIGPIGLPETPEDLDILVVNYLEPKSV